MFSSFFKLTLSHCKSIDSKKGFSIQSVIIGSILAAILSGVAFTNMWGSVDKAKVNTLASVIKEQITLFSSQPDYDFESLNTDGNPDDYLADLIDNGLLSPIPDVFEDPAALTWEVRQTVVSGYKKVFYATISSTNQEDQALIDDAIQSLNITGFFKSP